MCGRVRLPDDVSEIKLDLQIDWDNLGRYRPSWNVPPTSYLPVAVFAQGVRTLTAMRWGLIPSWAKDAKIGYSTFNVRAESVDTKPAFRGAWKAGRRCLIVVDGYYEWRPADKQRFAIALGNRGPMTVAGLWEKWRAPGNTIIQSVTTITTRANDLLARVHDRMPVLLASSDWPAWLGETPATENDLKALLRPYPSEQMATWPVSKRVGNVKNDDRELFEPLQQQG